MGTPLRGEGAPFRGLGREKLHLGGGGGGWGREINPSVLPPLYQTWHMI